MAIAREVARIVRENAAIDRAARESVRTNTRRSVRRVRRLGYSPERTEDATETVVRQVELLTAERVA